MPSGRGSASASVVGISCSDAGDPRHSHGLGIGRRSGSRSRSARMHIRGRAAPSSRSWRRSSLAQDQLLEPLHGQAAARLGALEHRAQLLELAGGRRARCPATTGSRANAERVMITASQSFAAARATNARRFSPARSSPRRPAPAPGGRAAATRGRTARACGWARPRRAWGPCRAGEARIAPITISAVLPAPTW